MDMEGAALAYLAHNWAVVPLGSQDKRPLVRWQAFQRGPPSADEVRGWYRRWPDAGVAIVTGAVSGLLVVDVDARHGGERSLETLEGIHGPLPRTMEVVTGGGGRHIYFEHPGGIVPNMVGLARGIDLRGDGGIVVAPPSLHPSGRAYAWKPSRGPDEAPLAAVPAWLLTLVTSASGRRGHPVSYWRRLVREGVAEGERNNTIASFTGHLLWHGVDVAVATELLLCWNAVRCRPPLSEEEVVQTVGSITRLHDRHEGDGGP